MAVVPVFFFFFWFFFLGVLLHFFQPRPPFLRSPPIASAQRMNHDLRNLAPPAMNVKVIAPGERKYRSVFCSVRYAFCLFCFVSSGHSSPPPFSCLPLFVPAGPMAGLAPFGWESA